MNALVLIVAILIVVKAGMQYWLATLNRRHTQAHAAGPPAELDGLMSREAYAKSVAYTLAKNRLQLVSIGWDALVLGLVLFSGWLPSSFAAYSRWLGDSLPVQGGFLFLVVALSSLANWPLDWHAQFHLEERFGFNTTTAKLWWVDRAKGMVLSVLLGYPLLLLVLWFANWSGPHWWLWVWASVILFELMLVLLAPLLILPLFNRFTPLPEGSLCRRLFALAAKTGFRAQSIQVMDGSKRSRHANAFFTGFGRFRKIVLFDTLLSQLGEREVAAVLAHEIGHYKRGHIPKMLAAAALGLLAGCFALWLLVESGTLSTAFGFPPGTSRAIAFLLCGLLAGTVTFWLTPLAGLWSRRYEYQADAFAAAAMEETGSMISALRKLNEKNLSNLTPHPLYSAFYYSHPTLLEREHALTGTEPEKKAHPL